MEGSTRHNPALGLTPAAARLSPAQVGHQPTATTTSAASALPVSRPSEKTIRTPFGVFSNESIVPKLLPHHNAGLPESGGNGRRHIPSSVVQDSRSGLEKLDLAAERIKDGRDLSACSPTANHQH